MVRAQARPEENKTNQIRLNTKLESQGLTPMTDLVKDFSNGVKLIEVSHDSTQTEPR